MDNAARALVIAGGFLIGLLIISICMYMYTSFKSLYQENLEIHDALEISTFNSFFINYPEKLDGWEAYNLVGKIKEINSSEDSLTEITLEGVINQDSYKETTFYFTESLSAKDAYTYSYSDTNGDGLIDYVQIK